MAKLLFAMEEMEEMDLDSEMESSIEEGEVADVQVEMEEEIADVAGDEEAIDSAEGAADQLEEVQELVEASAEEGEGLDPIAAEAVRIAVEAICARVGADPKQMGMYHLYANENFQSSSSRKANTVIAAEGIGEFLKELWAKIKAAVSALWAKVTAFWDKHIGSLGRVKKALESMQKKVSASKGNLKGDGTLEKIPGGLTTTFPGKGDLDNDRVSNFISTHKDTYTKFNAAVTKSDSLVAAAGEVVAATDAAAALTKLKAEAGKTNTVSMGTNDAPLSGGTYFEYEFEVDAEDGKVTTTVNSEVTDAGDTDGELDIASKDQMKALIKSTLEVIKNTSKMKETLAKSDKEFKKVISNVDSAIAKKEGSDKKEHRIAMKSIRGLHTGIATFSTKLVSADLRLAKGVLNFTNVCLKQYKG